MGSILIASSARTVISFFTIFHTASVISIEYIHVFFIDNQFAVPELLIVIGSTITSQLSFKISTFIG